MLLAFLLPHILTQSPFTPEEHPWSYQLESSGSLQSNRGIGTGLIIEIHDNAINNIAIEELHKLLVPADPKVAHESELEKYDRDRTMVIFRDAHAGVGRAYSSAYGNRQVYLGIDTYSSKDAPVERLDEDANPPAGQLRTPYRQLVRKDGAFPYRIRIGEDGWVAIEAGRRVGENNVVHFVDFEFRRGRALAHVTGESGEAFARAADYRILQDPNISLDRRAVRTVMVNGKPIRVTLQNGLEMVLARDLKSFGVQEAYRTVNGVPEAVLSFRNATKTVIPYQPRPKSDNGSGDIPSWTYQGDVVVPLRSTLAALKVPDK